MTDFAPHRLRDLFNYRAQLEARIAEDKEHIDGINAEIARRAEPGMRAAMGNKINGQTTFEVEGVAVKSSVSKSVTWDSDTLVKAGEAMGPDLATELLKVKLTASQTAIDTAYKNNRLSDDAMKLIETAKTVKIGEPKFEIKTK